MVNFSVTPYLSALLHNVYTVPQKWVEDIKYVEFNELILFCEFNNFSEF